MKGEEYNLWLCSIPGIGIRKLLLLEKELGTPEQVYRAGEERLVKIKGISARDAHNIVTSRQTFSSERMKGEMEGLDMRCTTWFSPEYPAPCRHLYDPPKRLFYRGALPKEQLCVAVVGARDCSVYGRETARRFASVLSAAGVGIISGMARGIDGWAHQGALEGGGRTYAVLGNSAEICYPAEHAGLYRSILKRGGVLSEYPPGTKAAPGFFPMRNRIISGLSGGVLVVEARKKSGSLITAEQALDQGKDVFAVPGRVGDSLSEGCNNLIREGAVLVTTPEDILDYYGIVCENRTENFKKNKLILERREKMVYASLSLEPKHLTVLAEEVQMDSAEVMGCILSLLKGGLVKEIGNHHYIRNVI